MYVQIKTNIIWLKGQCHGNFDVFISQLVEKRNLVKRDSKRTIFLINQKIIPNEVCQEKHIKMLWFSKKYRV